jgi:hypothetical protein
MADDPGPSKFANKHYPKGYVYDAPFEKTIAKLPHKEALRARANLVHQTHSELKRVKALQADWNRKELDKFHRLRMKPSIDRHDWVMSSNRGKILEMKKLREDWNNLDTGHAGYKTRLDRTVAQQKSDRLFQRRLHFGQHPTANKDYLYKKYEQLRRQLPGDTVLGSTDIRGDLVREKFLSILPEPLKPQYSRASDAVPIAEYPEFIYRMYSDGADMDAGIENNISRARPDLSKKRTLALEEREARPRSAEPPNKMRRMTANPSKEVMRKYIDGERLSKADTEEARAFTEDTRRIRRNRPGTMMLPTSEIRRRPSTLHLHPRPEAEEPQAKRPARLVNNNVMRRYLLGQKLGDRQKELAAAQYQTDRAERYENTNRLPEPKNAAEELLQQFDENPGGLYFPDERRNLTKIITGEEDSTLPIPTYVLPEETMKILDAMDQSQDFGIKELFMEAAQRAELYAQQTVKEPIPPATEYKYMPAVYKNQKKFSRAYKTPRPTAFKKYKRNTSGYVAGASQKIAPMRTKSLIPGYSSLNKLATTVIDQIIDPSSVVEAERWPNTYGLSATYKCRNVLEAKFDAFGRSIVAVHPRLRSAIHVTTGAQYSGQMGDSISPGVHMTLHQAITSNGPSIININEPLQCGNVLIYPVINQTDGSMCYENPFYGPSITDVTEGTFANATYGASTADLAFYVTGNLPAGNGRLQFTWLKADKSLFPVSALTDSVSVNPTVHNFATAPSRYNCGGDVSKPLDGVNASWKQARYFRIDLVTGLDVIDTVITGYFSFGGSGPYNTWNTYNHCAEFDLKDASVVLKDAERFFILGQSVLCTSMMSSNTNGGQIASARLPGDSTIGEGATDQTNYYEWIASLPYNSYNGPVKTGCYTFYLPEDETGFQYTRSGQLNFRGLSYCVAAFNIPDATGRSVRIQVDTVVQFTTNSTVYQLAPAKILTDATKIHYILSSLQSSYTNHGHTDALKAHLKRLAGKVKTQLLKPSNWASAGRAVAKYGAPVAAGLLL